MARPLDFIIFGVPRSGTTALGRYLGASREVFCFHEMLRFNDDHTGITAPDSFLKYRAHFGRTVRSDDKRPTPLERELERKAETTRLYGHKRPNYIYDLQRIVDESRCRKGLLCYRDVARVAGSFSSRALTDRDNWHPGRVGMFAALETMLMVHAMAHVRDIETMIVPQKALATDWSATVRAAVSFLDDSFEPTFDEAAVQGSHSIKDRAGLRAAPVIDPEDQKLIEIVQKAGVDELFSRDAPFPLADVIDEVREMSRALPFDLITIAERTAQAHPNPKAAEHAKAWKRRVRKGLKRLENAPADKEAGASTQKAI